MFQENYYHSLMASLQEDLFVIDRNYIVTDINSSALATLGLTREEALGKHCYEITHSQTEPCWNKGEDCRFCEVFETGEPRNCHHIHTRSDGTLLHLDILLSPLKDSEGNTTHVIEAARDVTDLFDTVEALKSSGEMMESIFRAAPTGIGVVSNRVIIEANARLCEMTGYSRQELLDKNALMLYPARDDYEYVGREKYRQIAEKGTGTVETVWKKKDGTIINVLLSSTPVDTSNLEKGVTFTALDITDRLRAAEEKEKLQAQLMQGRKMESVGKLAGGVAHDFNNMLSVILGHTEIALDQIEKSHPVYDDLSEIQNAARRSELLIRQLLAFARRQPAVPKALDLNETVDGMIKMLRSLITENIELVWRPCEGILPVKMDPVQVDQILANMCINARDAVSGAGKIIIETDSAAVDKSYCAGHAGFIPGDYIVLSVCDDGCGMDRETLENIFEPFFSTKNPGRGTGLGLATVYGIVRQNGGFINVYSEPGSGSCFKIYFPRYAGIIPGEEGDSREILKRGSGETILLVEDEQSILELGKTMLEKLGYNVLAAGSPAAAISFARDYKDDIDLLITDVVMPEINGRELSDRINKIKPEIKCLFMSGYTADVIAHHGVLDEEIAFIQKPFSIKDLALIVRKILDR